MPAGSTYDSIATTTLGSANSTISFSSISGSYTDLKLIVTGTISSGAGVYGLIRANSNSTANYSQEIIRGIGTGATAVSYTTASAFGGIVCNSEGYSTTIPFFIEVDVLNYAGSTNKVFVVKTSNDLNGSGSTEAIIGAWHSTAAITGLAFISSSSTFAAGTTAALYGITKA